MLGWYHNGQVKYGIEIPTCCRCWRFTAGTRPCKVGLVLRAVVLAGSLSVVALTAGWVVTEVGRRP